MKIFQGQLWLDNAGYTWYVEKTPSDEAVGLIKLAGPDDVTLTFSSSGYIFATQGQLMKQVDNVIQLFGDREDPSDGESTIEALFKQAMERNQRNKDRQQQDRTKANKGVLRSYRITTKE